MTTHMYAITFVEKNNNNNKKINP